MPQLLVFTYALIAIGVAAQVARFPIALSDSLLSSDHPMAIELQSINTSHRVAVFGEVFFADPRATTLVIGVIAVDFLTPGDGTHAVSSHQTLPTRLLRQRLILQHFHDLQADTDPLEAENADFGHGCLTTGSTGTLLLGVLSTSGRSRISVEIHRMSAGVTSPPFSAVRSAALCDDLVSFIDPDFMFPTDNKNTVLAVDAGSSTLALLPHFHNSLPWIVVALPAAMTHETQGLRCTLAPRLVQYAVGDGVHGLLCTGLHRQGIGYIKATFFVTVNATTADAGALLIDWTLDHMSAPFSELHLPPIPLRLGSLTAFLEFRTSILAAVAVERASPALMVWNTSEALESWSYYTPAASASLHFAAPCKRCVPSSSLQQDAVLFLPQIGVDDLQQVAGMHCHSFEPLTCQWLFFIVALAPRDLLPRTLFAHGHVQIIADGSQVWAQLLNGEPGKLLTTKCLVQLTVGGESTTITSKADRSRSRQLIRNNAAFDLLFFPIDDDCSEMRFVLVGPGSLDTMLCSLKLPRLIESLAGVSFPPILRGECSLLSKCGQKSVQRNDAAHHQKIILIAAIKNVVLTAITFRQSSNIFSNGWSEVHLMDTGINPCPGDLHHRPHLLARFATALSCASLVHLADNTPRFLIYAPETNASVVIDLANRSSLSVESVAGTPPQRAGILMCTTASFVVHFSIYRQTVEVFVPHVLRNKSLSEPPHVQLQHCITLNRDNSHTPIFTSNFMREDAFMQLEATELLLESGKSNFVAPDLRINVVMTGSFRRPIDTLLISGPTLDTACIELLKEAVRHRHSAAYLQSESTLTHFSTTVASDVETEIKTFDRCLFLQALPTWILPISVGVGIAFVSAVLGAMSLRRVWWRHSVLTRLSDDVPEWANAFRVVSADGVSVTPEECENALELLLGKSFRDCRHLRGVQELFFSFDRRGTGTLELSEFLALAEYIRAVINAPNSVKPFAPCSSPAGMSAFDAFRLDHTSLLQIGMPLRFSRTACGAWMSMLTVIGILIIGGYLVAEFHTAARYLCVPTQLMPMYWASSSIDNGTSTGTSVQHAAASSIFSTVPFGDIEWFVRIRFLSQSTIDTLQPSLCPGVQFSGDIEAKQQDYTAFRASNGCEVSCSASSSFGLDRAVTTEVRIRCFKVLASYGDVRRKPDSSISLRLRVPLFEAHDHAELGIATFSRPLNPLDQRSTERTEQWESKKKSIAINTHQLKHSNASLHQLRAHAVLRPAVKETGSSSSSIVFDSQLAAQAHVHELMVTGDASDTSFAATDDELPGSSSTRVLDVRLALSGDLSTMLVCTGASFGNLSLAVLLLSVLGGCTAVGTQLLKFLEVWFKGAPSSSRHRIFHLVRQMAWHDRDAEDDGIAADCTDTDEDDSDGGNLEAEFLMMMHRRPMSTSYRQLLDGHQRYNYDDDSDEGRNDGVALDAARDRSLGERSGRRVGAAAAARAGTIKDASYTPAGYYRAMWDGSEDKVELFDTKSKHRRRSSRRRSPTEVVW